MFEVSINDKIKVRVDTIDELMEIINKLLDERGQQIQIKTEHIDEKGQQAKKTKKKKKTTRKYNDPYHRFLSDCLRKNKNDLAYCIKLYREGINKVG